ncbi:integrase catalytic domain-containing protein [Trichonephila clavipes]|nr:integrase catalytic domain-containing protein [Trichonephila clavipes]
METWTRCRNFNVPTKDCHLQAVQRTLPCHKNPAAQLTKDEKSRFPLASETLLYDTYMDDIVSGAPDLETAQQLQSQLKDALQSCGMNLHKWSSNSPELLNSSLSSDVEHSFSTDIDLSVKTLGISWKPFEDCFVFKWREFVTTLKCIEEVKMNRFIMADNNVRIVLQGFVDASEAAYGAVVYLQCFLHNGAAKVSILASKSRVAPIQSYFHTSTRALCLCFISSTRQENTLHLEGLHPCDLPNLRLWWQGPQFLEKGKLSSEETILSPVKECEYSKELKTGSSSDIITSSVCVSTNCVSSILSTPLRKSANKELKRFLKLIEDSDDNLAGFLSAEGIEWKFLPPRAPSFGGLWEASVKSIKNDFSKQCGKTNGSTGDTFEEAIKEPIKVVCNEELGDTTVTEKTFVKDDDDDNDSSAIEKNNHSKEENNFSKKLVDTIEEKEAALMKEYAETKKEKELTEKETPLPEESSIDETKEKENGVESQTEHSKVNDSSAENCFNSDDHKKPSVDKVVEEGDVMSHSDSLPKNNALSETVEISEHEKQEKKLLDENLEIKNAENCEESRKEEITDMVSDIFLKYFCRLPIA